MLKSLFNVFVPKQLANTERAIVQIPFIRRKDGSNTIMNANVNTVGFMKFTATRVSNSEEEFAKYCHLKVRKPLESDPLALIVNGQALNIRLKLGDFVDPAVQDEVRAMVYLVTRQADKIPGDILERVRPKWELFKTQRTGIDTLALVVHAQFQLAFDNGAPYMLAEVGQVESADWIGCRPWPDQLVSPFDADRLKEEAAVRAVHQGMTVGNQEAKPLSRFLKQDT